MLIHLCREKAVKIIGYTLDLYKIIFKFILYAYINNFYIKLKLKLKTNKIKQNVTLKYTCCIV